MSTYPILCLCLFILDYVQKNLGGNFGRVGGGLASPDNRCGGVDSDEKTLEIENILPQNK